MEEVSAGFGVAFPASEPDDEDFVLFELLKPPKDASYEFLNQNRDHWEGTAAVNGEFKYLKMTDSRGKYLVFFFYPLDLWVLDVGILFD
ncbi:uncharacterized protein [Pocillopora verrucosa]|uniref:uncharacterized protein isoform X5 n=1 Tax=Pocillopora verrucosa TaxID=203993 RepID=UPI00334031B1